MVFSRQGRGTLHDKGGFHAIALNRERNEMTKAILISSWIVGMISFAPGESDSGSERAERILEETGTRGGLVVHVGCGDGKLTCEFGAKESFLVQGLDLKEEDVRKARQLAAAKGLHGRVSFHCFDGRRLPYVDNLVNLLVADDPGNLPSKEILRVLAPGGTALVGGKKTVKPRSESLDTWTHFLHGADNNPVARDRVVGPPRHVQWIAGPSWSRHHDSLASISALVSSEKRIFYVVDEGPTTLMHHSPQWRLVARDAFNGIRLWSREIEKWESPLRYFRTGPTHLPRRLVAAGGKVFVTLGYDGPVSAIEPATGRTIRDYSGTEGAGEILFHEDVLFVVVGGKKSDGKEKRIQAISMISNDLLWEKKASVQSQTVAVAGGRACFSVGKEVICLDSKTGVEKWRAGAAKEAGRRDASGWYAETLILTEGVVLWAKNGNLLAFSAESGKVLWDAPAKVGFESPSDLFVIHGKVWAFSSIGEKRPVFEERDLLTGIVKRTIDLGEVWTAGHHHRCYRNKATSRYLITSKRGLEYLELEGEAHARNNWVRGMCQYGVMPCNGLTYVPPHPCMCHPASKLNGFYALAPRRSTTPGEPQVERLVRGPAYRQARELLPPSSGGWKSESLPDSAFWRSDGITMSEDWPEFRHDPARSGRTPSRLPEKPVLLWRSELGGKATAPVMADGMVLVALPDKNEVQALDADTGELKWSFLAGGRVNSPPTLFGGLVVFGSADGWIYCLRRDDGIVVWRFLAARLDRKTVAHGRVESVWPLPGSLLISPGKEAGASPVVYAAAGRSGHLDGGIRICGVDLVTGEERFGTCAKLPHHVVTGETVPSGAYGMEGVLGDVLVANGTGFSMRQTTFDERGKIVPDGERKGLFAITGFLDDALDHRSFWILGNGGGRSDLICDVPRSTGNAPYGKMFVFDSNRAYGYRIGYDIREKMTPNHHQNFSNFGKGSFPRGGMIFSVENDSTSKKGKPVPQAAKSWKNPGLRRYHWSFDTPIQVRAMLLSPERLYLAGWMDEDNPESDQDGEGVLEIVSASEGKALGRMTIPASPVWDGMIAARGRLYLVDRKGCLSCFGRR